MLTLIKFLLYSLVEEWVKDVSGQNLGKCSCNWDQERKLFFVIVANFSYSKFLSCLWFFSKLGEFST